MVIANGMRTTEWRAAKRPDYYNRGKYVPGLKVTLIHALLDWVVKFLGST